MKGTYQHLTHEAFGPLYDATSRVLILGSFPSVKSREAAFYYGHKQNRFWPVIARLFDWTNIPESKEEKAALILQHHLALWDVIEECDIIGSSDASIKNVQVTDIEGLRQKTQIGRIFINGTAAYNLFMKYQSDELKELAVKLPSTSPANAAWTMDRLLPAWDAVRKAVMDIPG